MFLEYHEEKVKAILVWTWHSASVAYKMSTVSVKKPPEQQGKLRPSSLGELLLPQLLLCTAAGCVRLQRWVPRCALAALGSCSWSHWGVRGSRVLQVWHSHLVWCCPDTTWSGWIELERSGSVWFQLCSTDFLWSRASKKRELNSLCLFMWGWGCTGV